MLTCNKCGLSEPEAEFYSRPKTECKECVKLRVRARARTNPAVQEYDRARAKSPERKARAREITREWRSSNPEGYRAHTAVSNAIRDGRLRREPCMFCGAGEVHAHHKDYAKPLDVIWLCQKCHHRLHAAFPETEGANKREGRA